uniref:Saccharopine dehydrogenase (NAD(+), L-lysine-forming) n=1 Tax=Percolomonas cosmopolitus TaxID=63605 RepID=A0A7S1KL63_9EUKA|mmetsp:Transcript_10654/g.39764  ORF Transcript_10654/g.39764 Transcript_10654/m.39764 type:complete len:433 (+) Transcript_10654:1873-3171(+)
MTLSTSTKPLILLRAEYKPNEHRTPLTPSHLSSLTHKYNFIVETSQERIFSDKEYENAGAKIVNQGEWLHFCERYDKDGTGYVLGLKELPEPKEVMQCEIKDESKKIPIETPFAVRHRHIMFAHCYKYQNDWKSTMQRFKEGNAELLDLEFLQWDNGRRVAAFGRAAGFAGMAVGMLGYVAQQQQLEKNPQAQNVNLQLDWYRNNADLVNLVKKQLATLKEQPVVLVLGALGRCGGGAVQFAREAGLPEEKVIQWDLEETKVGGPFLELLLKPHILVNCIYVNGKIPPFIDQELLSQVDSRKERRLSVFVDVSCEMSQNNPFPINNKITTFPDPLRRLVQPLEGVPPLDCCAIDHLPAMIPRQSSEDFSQDLYETLARLGDADTTRELDQLEKLAKETDENDPEMDEKKHLRVWYRAKALFQKKLRELEESQ